MGVGDDTGLVFQHLQGVLTSNGEEFLFHSGKVYPPMRELPSFQQYDAQVVEGRLLALQVFSQSGSIHRHIGWGWVTGQAQVQLGHGEGHVPILAYKAHELTKTAGGFEAGTAIII